MTSLTVLSIFPFIPKEYVVDFSVIFLKKITHISYFNNSVFFHLETGEKTEWCFNMFKDQASKMVLDTALYLSNISNN